MSTLLGNCSTGTTTAKRPWLLSIKTQVWQTTLIENSLQLERHVPGFPLVSPKDTYSVTEKQTTSAFSSHQRPVHISIQEEQDWGAVGWKLPFVWALERLSTKCISNHSYEVLHKSFSLQEAIGFWHWSVGSYTDCAGTLSTLFLGLKQSSLQTLWGLREVEGWVQHCGKRDCQSP